MLGYWIKFFKFYKYHTSNKLQITNSRCLNYKKYNYYYKIKK